jgi:hypothetical protein
MIKRSKTYYGEPAEYKENAANILLINEESKWKQVPANCK